MEFFVCIAQILSQSIGYIAKYDMTIQNTQLLIDVFLLQLNKKY